MSKEIITTLAPMIPQTEYTITRNGEEQTRSLPVPVVDGTRVVPGDTLRLYKERSQAKKPRPLIRTVEKMGISRAPSLSGGFERYIKIRFTDGTDARWHYFQSDTPQLSFLTERGTYYIPFRTQKAYESYKQYLDLHKLMHSLTPALAHTGTETMKRTLSEIKDEITALIETLD